MKRWIFLFIFIIVPSFSWGASSNWDSLVWDSDVWDVSDSGTSYTLSVSKSGTGTAAITSSPTGISCGSTCSAAFTSGTSVTLTAAPDSGYTVSSWSGCDSSSGNTCSVTMSSAKSVTATLGTGTSCSSTYTLSSTSASFSSSGGSGSVSVTASNALCAWSAATNASWITVTSPSTYTGSGTVTYTVAANTGNISRTGTLSIAGQTFTVTQDAYNMNTLTVTKYGSGLGTVTANTGTLSWSGNTGTASYVSGTSLKLSAMADSGSSFTGWTGCDNATGNTCIVSMSAAKPVTATFSKNNTGIYTLTVVKSGTGSGMVSSSSGAITWTGNSGVIIVYNAGTQLTLKAVAGSGSKFKEWSGCDSVYNNLCGISLTTDKTVNVTFTGGGKFKQNKFDYDGDGKTDILWRNKVYGYNAVWLMDNTTVREATTIDTVTDPLWTISGTGHFNQDNKTGIIWRNKMTGDTAIWLLDGSKVSGGSQLDTISDIEWEIVSAGDTDSDNSTDVIWRNKNKGYNAKWKIKKAKTTSMVMLPSFDDANWEIAGTGDFYGNGNISILWRHKLYGYNALWYMDGDTVSGTDYMPSMSDTNWGIVGMGDFNGDGITDIIWRHKTSGQNVIWLVNGLYVTDVVVLPTMSDMNWEIVAPR